MPASSPVSSSLAGRMRPRPPSPPKRNKRKMAQEDRTKRDPAPRKLKLQPRTQLIEAGHEITAAKGKGRAIEDNEKRSSAIHPSLAEQGQSSRSFRQDKTSRLSIEVRPHWPERRAASSKTLEPAPIALPSRRIAAPASRTPGILTASNPKRSTVKLAEKSLPPRSSKRKRTALAYAESSDDGAPSRPPMAKHVSKAGAKKADMPRQPSLSICPLPPRPPEPPSKSLSLSEPPTGETLYLLPQRPPERDRLEVHALADDSDPPQIYYEGLAHALQAERVEARRMRRARLHRERLIEPHGEALDGWAFPLLHPSEYCASDGRAMRYWRDPPVRHVVEDWALEHGLSEQIVSQEKDFKHVRGRRSLATSGRGVLVQLLTEDPSLLPRILHIAYSPTALVRILIPTSRALPNDVHQLVAATPYSDSETDGLRRLGLSALLWCDDEVEAALVSSALQERGEGTLMIWTPAALRALCEALRELCQEATQLSPDDDSEEAVGMSYQVIHAHLPPSLTRHSSIHLDRLLCGIEVAPSPSTLPSCDAIAVVLPQSLLESVLNTLRAVKVGGRVVLQGALPVVDEEWGVLGLA